MSLTAAECRVVEERAKQCRVEWGSSFFASRETIGPFTAAELLCNEPGLLAEGCPAIAVAALRGDLSGHGISRAAMDIWRAYGPDYYADLAGAPQRVVMFFRDLAAETEALAA